MRRKPPRLTNYSVTCGSVGENVQHFLLKTKVVWNPPPRGRPGVCFCLISRFSGLSCSIFSGIFPLKVAASSLICAAIAHADCTWHFLCLCQLSRCCGWKHKIPHILRARRYFQERTGKTLANVAHNHKCWVNWAFKGRRKWTVKKFGHEMSSLWKHTVAKWHLNSFKSWGKRHFLFSSAAAAASSITAQVIISQRATMTKIQTSHAGCGHMRWSYECLC